MTLTNLGFETDGTTPGSADGWTYTFLAQAQHIAPVDPAQERPVEDFERDWSVDGYVADFSDDNIELKSFSSLLTPHQFDDFEEGWSTNQGYLNELISLEMKVFSGSIGYDNFESGWSNDTYYVDVPSITTMLFNTTTDAQDSFEREWSSNESYLTSMSGAYFYDFGGVGYYFDSFEFVYLKRQVSVSSSVFTIGSGTGLIDGDIVFFSTSADGALPSGLNSGIEYYVVSSTSTTFQVASTSGGSAITFGDVGFGEIFVYRTPKVYWHTNMETI